MQVPLEVTYRNVEKTPQIEELIARKMAKLEQVCNYITSCRISVERRQRPHRTGNPYFVRIDIRVPPGHELVVRRTSLARGGREEALPSVVRRAFDAGRRRLQELVEKQRGEVKSHPEQEVNAFVERIFAADGYGFLRTLDGQEVYFHRNSVLRGEFDRLERGTGVRFVEAMGVEGLQASTVEAVERLGSPVARA